MKTEHKVSLKSFNTFGVEANAERLVKLECLEDIGHLSANSFDREADLVLGGGSNILFCADLPGTLYLNRIKGRNIIGEDDASVLVEVSAGENWHEFVLWALDQGFSGLENLSLIPGLAGAAPMQNIGAYGVEISALMDSVNTYDWRSGEVVNMANEECRFSYRDSRFKSIDPGRFLILSCRLRLPKEFVPCLSYAGLTAELSAMNVDDPNAKQVSDAVVRIRQRKLPDPAVLGNAGSFFKNPEVSTDIAEYLQSQHQQFPVYSVAKKSCKLSAAWMIEQCGWKGFRQGDAGVSEDHALVLVNHGTAKGSEIFSLSEQVAESVLDRFGIVLEREPQVFGNTS